MLTFVTAFLDIGRAKWQHFTRTFEDYLQTFLPFQYYKENIILFLDNKYLDKIPVASNITIVPISLEFMENNIFCWSLLERERAIMQDPKFRELVALRSIAPETHIPEYTLLNHAKIDFINLAIKKFNLHDNVMAWIDFGYFKTWPTKIPNKLNLENFDLERINYTLINYLSPEDIDIVFTLKNAPEKVAGYFFIGNADIMKKYQILYHEVLLDFQKRGFADDDQALVIRCFLKYPAMFDLLPCFQWHVALDLFEIKN